MRITDHLEWFFLVLISHFKDSQEKKKSFETKIMRDKEEEVSKRVFRIIRGDSIIPFTHSREWQFLQESEGLRIR
jgi:hypothetical protein